MIVSLGMHPMNASSAPWATPPSLQCSISLETPALAPDPDPDPNPGDAFERLPGGYYAAHGRVDDTMNLGGIKVSFYADGF
jgi:hypothetical protein